MRGERRSATKQKMKQRAWGNLPSRRLHRGPCQGAQDAGKPAKGLGPHWTTAWRIRKTPASWTPPGLKSPQEKALMKVRTGSVQTLGRCLLPAVARKLEQLLEVSPTLPTPLIRAVNLQAPQPDLFQEWVATVWVTSCLHGQTADPQRKLGLGTLKPPTVGLIPRWSTVT